MNPKQPRAEAVFVRGGQIVAVGSIGEIQGRADRHTRVINAKGMMAVPGLADCHVHMTGFGHSLQEADLRDTDSMAEFKQRIRKFAQEHPEKSWVTGGSWNQERFAEKRYPTRWDVDEAVGDRPACLMRVCGHVGVVNSKALQLAGITEDTHVEGGNIDVDEATRKPNGILRENALEPIWRMMPKKGVDELEKACLAACRKAVEAGLTCVHWMVTSVNEIKALRNLCIGGGLPLRVRLGVDVSLVSELGHLGLLSDSDDDMLRFGFVKILADGSLGASTAALKEPYADRPDTRGMMLFTQKELNELVSKTHAAKLQLAIHAIGDHAMESVLKAYERALKENPRGNHRHRIEHCSVLNPMLIKRMKQSNLVASVQPHFVVSDFWAEDRVGKARARWMFPFKTLVEEGIVVVSGSDCPVENISPILGIWAAVDRKNFPQEALTVEEALRTYTMNAAYSSFEERRRGSIEVGKLADFTVLSDNLIGMPPERIKNVGVEMTIVGGNVAYSRN